MTRVVVIVVHEPTVGGATNAVLRAIPDLQEEGWEFRFWAPTPSPVAALVRERGHLVAGEPRPIRYSWSALAEPPGRRRRIAAIPGYMTDFRRFIDRNAPDLVHANTVLTLPEALTARTAGAPTLLHVHEMLPAGPRGAVAARLARLVDGVAAVSRANAGALLRHGVPSRIVTAGIAARDRAPAPRRPGPVVVGTLATVSRRKGSDLFAAAAAAILERRSDVEFRMVGPLAGGREHAWASDVSARAERAGIRRSTAADVDAELAEWDLFVLPTRQDPFPLGVLEAMAAGLPVIASRVDGVPEQIGTDAGVLVAPDDPDSLRAAIVGLLDDPERREQMGRAGRRRVVEHFTPERHARELAGAYEGAINGSSRDRPGGQRFQPVPAGSLREHEH